MITGRKTLVGITLFNTMTFCKKEAFAIGKFDKALNTVRLRWNSEEMNGEILASKSFRLIHVDGISGRIHLVSTEVDVEMIGAHVFRNKHKLIRCMRIPQNRVGRHVM